VPWLIEESVAGHGGLGGKDVTLVLDDSPSQGVIQITFLPELPGDELANVAVLLDVDSVCQGVVEFFGVGEEFGFVEADEFAEVVDAGDPAEAGSGFDHVFVFIVEYA